MLKPSQIREMEFSKSTMGGYKTSEVNSFLDEVAESYEQLYKENSELLKKLRLLVDNIEEYRKREQNGELTSNPSLDDAREEADKIIAEAKLEAEQIIENANNRAAQADDSMRASIDEFRQLREKEESAYLSIKSESEKFRKSLLSMYTEHLSLIQSMVDGKSARAELSDKKEDAPLKKLDIKEIKVEEEFTYDDIDAFFEEAMSDEQSRIKEAFGGFRFEMGAEPSGETQLQIEESVSDFEEPACEEETENEQNDIIVEAPIESNDIIVESSEVIIEFPSEAELSKDDESADDSDDMKPSFKISFPEDEETADAEENLDDLFEGFFNSSDKSE